MHVFLLLLIFTFGLADNHYTVDGPVLPDHQLEIHYLSRDKRLSDTSGYVDNTTLPQEEATSPTTTTEDSDSTSICGVNFTHCIKDDHKYYIAQYVNDSSLWIELNPEENPELNGTRHVSLSDSKSRYGYSNTLTMDNFLFYGLPIKNITILTGGFLHVGVLRLSQYLTRLQYIAPFMGNFNPSLSNDSNIFYYTDSERFIVQWDKVFVEDMEELGRFTFQVQLLKNNNDIVFAYKEMPTAYLSDKDHANNVGVSDAYHLWSPNSMVVNVYHEVNLNKTRLGNNTAVKLIHQKLCTMITDCYNCTTAALQDFDCRWCERLGKCSDRVGDSKRNDWYSAGCTIDYKRAGQCDDYCYYPDRDVNHTTYTPPRDVTAPIIFADQDMSAKVRVECESGYSVSTHFNMTADESYCCTSGGVELPRCYKSCNYTTPPENGALKGAKVGTLLKPDSEFILSCDAKHRVKNGSPTSVKCIDDGVLEPDPASLKCEKFCVLPHPEYAVYHPTPENDGYLHEGESTTLVCYQYHYLSDAYPNTTEKVTCTEDTDFGSLASERCVGYCVPKYHPNTTYTPHNPRIKDVVTVTCDNGTSLEEGVPSNFTCEKAGVMELPGCVAPTKQKVIKSSSALPIVLAIFIVAIIAVIGGWVLYAYRNPTSPSGLFLIEKCRPWTWRNHAYRRHQESLAESYYLDGGI